jgi:hypothetical protein
VHVLLRRYGVICWRLLEREAAWLPPWRDLVRVCRRLEARGEIRGGRFIAGVSGEQFALPEAQRLDAERHGRHEAHLLFDDVPPASADPNTSCSLGSSLSSVWPLLLRQLADHVEDVAIEQAQQRTVLVAVGNGRWVGTHGVLQVQGCGLAPARIPGELLAREDLVAEIVDHDGAVEVGDRGLRAVLVAHEGSFQLSCTSRRPAPREFQR